MSEMVERVALAIYDRPTTLDGDQIGVHLGSSMVIEESCVDAASCRELVMSVCRDAARAAIEALAEADDKFMEQWGERSHDGRFSKSGETYPVHRNFLRAMIDAALSPTPEQGDKE